MKRRGGNKKWRETVSLNQVSVVFFFFSFQNYTYNPRQLFWIVALRPQSNQQTTNCVVMLLAIFNFFNSFPHPSMTSNVYSIHQKLKINHMVFFSKNPNYLSTIQKKTLASLSQTLRFITPTPPKGYIVVRDTVVTDEFGSHFVTLFSFSPCCTYLICVHANETGPSLT